MWRGKVGFPLIYAGEHYRRTSSRQIAMVGLRVWTCLNSYCVKSCSLPIRLGYTPRRLDLRRRHMHPPVARRLLSRLVGVAYGLIWLGAGSLFAGE